MDDRDHMEDQIQRREDKGKRAWRGEEEGGGNREEYMYVWETCDHPGWRGPITFNYIRPD